MLPYVGLGYPIHGGVWGGHLTVPLQTEVPLDGEVILCCYRAVNPYYYKYAVGGINVFAVSILSLFWGRREDVGEGQIPPQ